MGPNVDPRTLCPWCDEPLPPEPTPHLLNLIQVARRHSYANARLTNPLGISGPPTAFVGVCQRHRFETHQMPMAQKNGWPTQIEWESVPGRVKALAGRLREIVDDVDEDFLPEAMRVDGAGGDARRVEDRPRLQSIFWKDLAGDVKMHGSRQATGVKGQFDSFSRTQPG